MLICLGFCVAKERIVSKTVRQIKELAKIHLRSVGRIPVDDAVEALRFCQVLARQVAAETGDDVSDIQADAPTQSHTHPELSVVLPVYNEAENIAALYERLVSVLERENLDFEILFVDDGSKDETAEKLSELEASDERVHLIGLARNFGHQVAITAGLDFARGRAVAVMDADLQDPPEVLPKFIAKWREGHDVVYAIREHRKEGWLKRTSYAAFYRLLRHVSNIEIPLDAGDFCVMDRRVVDLLKNMPERSRFVRGIRSWVGFSQVGLPFERHARHAGTSKYTIGRLMLLALDGLISFSYVPLRFITALGLSVSFLSLFLAVFFFVKKLLYELSPPGYASLIVSIFFLAGIQLVTLGVIGEYVGRIFEEAKRRPMYVLRRTSGSR
jgi:glycosyltransferase involved in cell wall biosynthesis